MRNEHQSIWVCAERQGPIETDYTKTCIRGKADLKLTEVDVRTLVHDKADLSAIETAMKKSPSTRTTLRLKGVKALRAAADVLTPEQREKLRDTSTKRHNTDAQPENSSERSIAALHNLPDEEG